MSMRGSNFRSNTCPQTCQNKCKMKNIAFLQYEYGSGSSTSEKSDISNEVSICVKKEKSRNPSFSLIKDVNKDTTEPGDVLTYKVYVTNTGDTLLTDIILNDELDVDTTYVAGSVSVIRKPTGEEIGIPPVVVSYDESSNVLTINANTTLRIGETFIFSYEVDVAEIITDDNLISNTVTVDTNETDSQDDDTAVAIEYARVSIEKEIINPLNATCVKCGDDLTYTITVTNYDGTATATNLVITDLFDSEFYFDVGDVTVSPSAGTDVDIDDDGILTVTIEELNAGGSVEITVEGEVCCCRKGYCES